jgi:transcriptional regulator with XRE-family HTH domain
MGRREGVDVYFRKQLRREREGRGWSQADVAKRLSDNGIPMYGTTVAKIESGERAVRVDEAAGIADLLEVPLDWLLGRQSAGPGAELRYVLRSLTEHAGETISAIGRMMERLQDWDTDTFELMFDGKDELDADLKDIAQVLNQANLRLARLVTLELPEDAPIWQVDLDKFHDFVEDLQAQMPPLERIESDEASDNRNH